MTLYSQVVQYGHGPGEQNDLVSVRIEWEISVLILHSIRLIHFLRQLASLSCSRSLLLTSQTPVSSSNDSVNTAAGVLTPQGVS